MTKTQTYALIAIAIGISIGYAWKAIEQRGCNCKENAP